MPYRSETIKIAGTKNDARVKLTPEDKLLMKEIRETQGTSYQKIADQFGVSKRTAIFVCNPESLEACKEARERRGGSMIYYNKEKNTEIKRLHRARKQELFLAGEIKL